MAKFSEDDIKFILLLGGLEVISKIEDEDDDFVHMKNPMVLNRVLLEGKIITHLHPLVNDLYFKGKVIPIRNEAMITILPASTKLASFYGEVLKKKKEIRKKLKNGGKLFPQMDNMTSSMENPDINDDEGVEIYKHPKLKDKKKLN